MKGKLTEGSCICFEDISFFFMVDQNSIETLVKKLGGKGKVGVFQWTVDFIISFIQIISGYLFEFNVVLDIISKCLNTEIVIVIFSSKNELFNSLFSDSKFGDH